MTELTLTATEFRSRCRKLLDRLHDGELTMINVTLADKIVAVVTPVPSEQRPER